LSSRKRNDLFVPVHGGEIERRLAVWRLGFQYRAAFDGCFDRCQVSRAGGREQIGIGVSPGDHERKG
jgi:hypothetical protein